MIVDGGMATVADGRMPANPIIANALVIVAVIVANSKRAAAPMTKPPSFILIPAADYGGNRRPRSDDHRHRLDA